MAPVQSPVAVTQTADMQQQVADSDFALRRHCGTVKIGGITEELQVRKRCNIAGYRIRQRQLAGFNQLHDRHRGNRLAH